VEIMENGQKIKKILHLELETTIRDIHESNMDYHAMIARKYKKMEIAHYVLFFTRAYNFPLTNYPLQITPSLQLTPYNLQLISLPLPQNKKTIRCR
jgi:hypothetical protein